MQFHSIYECILSYSYLYKYRKNERSTSNNNSHKESMKKMRLSSRVLYHCRKSTAQRQRQSQSLIYLLSAMHLYTYSISIWTNEPIVCYARFGRTFASPPHHTISPSNLLPHSDGVPEIPNCVLQFLQLFNFFIEINLVSIFFCHKIISNINLTVFVIVKICSCDSIDFPPTKLKSTPKK